MRSRKVLLVITLVSVFLLLVVGAYVTAGGFGGACGTDLGRDWPLCNGQLLPGPHLDQIAEYSHRILASLSALFLFVTTFLFWRAKDAPTNARKALYAASFLIVLEIVLGGIVVVQSLDAVLVTFHQATALLIFGLTVAASTIVLRRS